MLRAAIWKKVVSLSIVHQRMKVTIVTSSVDST